LIFILNACAIYYPDDLFEQEAVFIVMGNDKVHGKDFELDANEKTLFFANEYMKSVYSSRFSKADRVAKRAEKRVARAGVAALVGAAPKGARIPEELLGNYEVGGVIGEGHYAVVHQCRDINTGMVFALKIIDLKKCVSKVGSSIWETK